MLNDSLSDSFFSERLSIALHTYGCISRIGYVWVTYGEILYEMCVLAEKFGEQGLRGKSMSTSHLSQVHPGMFESKFCQNFARPDITFHINRHKELEYSLREVCGWFSISAYNKPEPTAVTVLSRLVNLLPFGEKVGVSVEHTGNLEVINYKRIDLPGISSRVKPDVSVVLNRAGYKAEYVFLAEVLSKLDTVSTTRKLCFDLLLQLIYLRNTNKTVYSISGVLFPTIEVKCQILLVTLTWEPKKFKFVASFKNITKDSIKTELPEAIAMQLQHVRKAISIQNIPLLDSEIYFSDAISEDDIEAYLGLKNFRFFPSKFSVVGYSINKPDEVYKISTFSNRAPLYLTLQGVVLKQVLLLSNMIEEADVYRRLKPPLRVNEIQLCFRAFAESVYSAIKELHSKTKYAHMDIRIPNICYDDDTDGEVMAVLIDVDNLSDVPFKTDESVMYNVSFTEAKMYDWRHYAIMLASIMRGTTDHYHATEPKFCENNKFEKFLRDCFTFGKVPDEPPPFQDLVSEPKSLRDMCLAV